MNLFLAFSDAAKYADIAANLILGLGYGSNFSFWSPAIFTLIKENIFSYSITPPIMPFSIAIVMKLIGINDISVVLTSIIYFVLTLFFVFLLAKKVFNNKLIGALSVIAVGSNYDLIHYALSGASESPFIFEIVLGSYLISMKNRRGNILALVVMILMYFTRPQAFIYIAGLILYFFLLNFNNRKAFIYFAITVVSGFLIDYFVLRQLTGTYFLYSILGRGLSTSFNQSSTASDSLRGAIASDGGFGALQILKNIFYNLYNFYKLAPQIINPYLLAFFVVGYISLTKNRLLNSFKSSAIFMVGLTLILTAATIPFFRYLHPVIPLVYIIGVGTIVEILNTQITNYKQIKINKFQVPKQLFLVFGSFLLIFIFSVGQTLGIFLLDSRFEKKRLNVGKPPLYYQLSIMLKDNTNSEQLILTNLDTWASWYGKRKTVWFPLSPKQIIDPSTNSIPFDAIYLTSYLIDDPNYYMGDDWRQIFENPTDPAKWICEGCDLISKEFELKGIYKVDPSEVYEKEGAKGILWVKR